MSKRVLVITTSLRQGKSSKLADAFIKGAREAGHVIESIQLGKKRISFCTGCLSCQSTKNGHCILQDDADVIIQKMKAAEVIVFATPIYFYEMSGQMKTLLDRTNPLFPIDYAFRDIYLLTAAADTEKTAMEGAIKGLEGWIKCFEKAKLKGVVYGVNAEDEENTSLFDEAMIQAYEMGRRV